LEESEEEKGPLEVVRGSSLVTVTVTVTVTELNYIFDGKKGPLRGPESVPIT
jgi:hypothetical protein